MDAVWHNSGTFTTYVYIFKFYLVQNMVGKIKSKTLKLQEEYPQNTNVERTLLLWILWQPKVFPKILTILDDLVYSFKAYPLQITSTFANIN